MNTCRRAWPPRADKYAVVRTLSHRDNNHLMSTHHLLTGHLQPGAFFDKVASRDDWPNYSSALDYLRPRSDGLPSGINLPTFLREGPLTWPGQYTGFLGPRFDPLQITRDPNKPNLGLDCLEPAPGIDVIRLNDRHALLDEVDRQQARLSDLAAARRISDQQQLAFSMLTSGRIARAFAMDRETGGRPAIVMAGMRSANSYSWRGGWWKSAMPVVQANMGGVQNWDTHGNNFGKLRNELLPPLDQGVAALLDDLESSVVCWTKRWWCFWVNSAERPKISTQGTSPIPGRDHWGRCFFGLFAGAGVRGGQVIGRSDAIAAYPATTPYTPDDVGRYPFIMPWGLGPGGRGSRSPGLNRPVHFQ